MFCLKGRCSSDIDLLYFRKPYNAKINTFVIFVKICFIARGFGAIGEEDGPVLEGACGPALQAGQWYDGHHCRAAGEAPHTGPSSPSPVQPDRGPGKVIQVRGIPQYYSKKTSREFRTKYS